MPSLKTPPKILVTWLIYILLRLFLEVFGQSWDSLFHDFPMHSGESIHITAGTVFITFAIFMLSLDIINATDATDKAIGKELFGLTILIVAIIAFFMVPHAAEPTYFLLLVISAVEVVSNIVILVKVSRRDISFGG